MISIPAPSAFSNKEDTAIKVNPVFSFIGLPECGPLLTTVSGYRNPVFVPFLCKKRYKHLYC